MLELELGTFDLRQLLEGSLVMVKERALAHGITLSLEVADDVDTLTGDERKVKQILFNLLSNAVKFTPDGGKVGITATRADAMVQVAVWDTGVGIPADDQQRIFEAFQQVGQGLAGKTEGTGLGLPLAKKFVELHGGTIWVESTPGHGSTLYLYAASCRYSEPCTLADCPGRHGSGPGARGRAGICGSPGVGCRRRFERSRSPPHLSI
jgi:signal transduction histidine kinase